MTPPTTSPRVLAVWRLPAPWHTDATVAWAMAAGLLVLTGFVLSVEAPAGEFMFTLLLGSITLGCGWAGAAWSMAELTFSFDENSLSMRPSAWSRPWIRARGPVPWSQVRGFGTHAVVSTYTERREHTPDVVRTQVKFTTHVELGEGQVDLVCGVSHSTAELFANQLTHAWIEAQEAATKAGN